jgi:phage FluMu protein Com
MLWFVLLLIGVIGLAVMRVHFSKQKCPKCKKRNCVIISREKTGTKRISIQKEEVIKHVKNKHGLYGGAAEAHARLTSQFGSPDSTTVRKYTVPGERTFCNVGFSCNICGEKFTHIAYEDHEI